MVKIISDSTCDLSQELIQQYDITIIPLHILLRDADAGQVEDAEGSAGQIEYEDGLGITPDQIFEWSDKHNKTPKTSAPSIESAIGRMKPLLDQGHELICFAISESMSTSANIMRLAADELDAGDRVTVINSRNLSTGIGLLVIEAAIMAGQGLDVGAIRDKIEEMIPLVRSSFVVDTMVYLRRGGRCNAVTALAGSALRIHPEILVTDGVMHVGRKYRGRLDRVILKYARDLEKDLVRARTDRVFITHSGCNRAVVEGVKDYLQSLDYFKEIHITRAGGVISSHCGPGTLGILFIDRKQ